MDSALYMYAAGIILRTRFRNVGAIYLNNVTVCIFFKAVAFNNIGAL